jgi:hypothetical protein
MMQQGAVGDFNSAAKRLARRDGPTHPSAAVGGPPKGRIMSAIPICRSCQIPFDPLSEHDRQKLGLADNFRWICRVCWRASDGKTLQTLGLLRKVTKSEAAKYNRQMAEGRRWAQAYYRLSPAAQIEGYNLLIADPSIPFGREGIWTETYWRLAKIRKDKLSRGKKNEERNINIVLQRDVRGMTFGQIAKAYGMKPDAVEKVYKRHPLRGAFRRGEQFIEEKVLLWRWATDT